jgi:hypothetical protein
MRAVCAPPPGHNQHIVRESISRTAQTYSTVVSHSQRIETARRQPCLCGIQPSGFDKQCKVNAEQVNGTTLCRRPLTLHIGLGLNTTVSEDDLALVMRLRAKTDLRNTDTNRLTSLAYAALYCAEEVFEWLLLDAGHDDEELSRVRSAGPPSTDRYQR